MLKRKGTQVVEHECIHILMVTAAEEYLPSPSAEAVMERDFSGLRSHQNVLKMTMKQCEAYGF